MDNRPARSCESYIEDNGNQELRRNFKNNRLHKNCGLLRSLSGEPDLLEAVKLDPAVLEAQVTMPSKDNVHEKINDTNRQSSKDPETENETAMPKSSAMKGYEDMMSQYEQAISSLTPSQLNMLLKYTALLRKQRECIQNYMDCGFCKNNTRAPCKYTPHVLKDDSGRVRCPVLRRYRCPRCGATGDSAHTLKYCPHNSFKDTNSM